mmetsp:Transcript_23475/g.47973  ORF Transcript_23475/g.47973 Transcript_23475/m.47973 type:complete len:131 (+) Transcript_23475:52-444(+)
MDDPIGKRVSIFWPDEDNWFTGVVTEKGRQPDDAPGVYNNVGWRVEYDDGDMGWVTDLNDASKAKFIGSEAPDAPPLMAAVATSVDAHASGTKVDLGADAMTSLKQHSERNSASFSDAAPAVVPRSVGDK